MKKVLFIMAVALVALTACQKKAEKAENVNEESSIYTVDQIFAQGESLLGDTILLQGNCLHLCKHSGKKAFLRNGEEGEFLLCLLGEKDDPFAGECLNNILRVRGVVHALEVQQPKEEHHEHAEGEEECGVCSSVKKYCIETLSYEIVAE